MRIDIISSVPELMTSPLNESILRRAQEHPQVDDYPFGGEAGMVMKCEPVFELVEKLQAERPYDEIVYTSPDGVRYDQHEANRLSTLRNTITFGAAEHLSRAKYRSATTCSRAANWRPASSPIRWCGSFRAPSATSRRP